VSDPDRRCQGSRRDRPQGARHRPFPLLDLLVDNEDVLKIFHAGGQDVEIIYNLTGKTPHPIFDTQIAMMAISQSEQIGYSNLVEAWLGLTIDKGARFTDWSRRP
jgi:ribonuclease D